MNSTFVVAMIVIGGLALIVALLVVATRKQTRIWQDSMREQYRALVREHSLAPDAEQEFPNRILGLDSHRRVLVAYLPGADTSRVVVPLANVVDCTVRKEGVTLQQGRRAGKRVTEEHINGISLSLRLRNGTAVDVPVWSEVLDGVEEKITLHKSAVTWQARIKAALAGTGSAPRLAMAAAL